MLDTQVMDMATAGGFGWCSRRGVNVLSFLIGACGLGYAYYAQFGQGFEPCPLCIFQRLALLVVAVVFLVAALHHPRGWGAKLYGIVIGLAAGVGAGIAARHVWLQHLPPEEAPRCGPGLDYMLQTLPLSETIRTVLTGSGECAKVDWTLLGLSMPAWTLLLFLALGVVGVLNNWRLRH